MSAIDRGHLGQLCKVEVIAGVFIAFCVLGCRGENGEKEKVYEDIIALGPERFDSVLEGYPLEEQVDIYLECKRRSHPPVCGSRVLARRGEKIVPVLMEAFKESRDLENRRAIISVFADMSCWYYDLSGHEEVLDSAEEVVRAIEDRRIRKYTSLDLRIIKRETCPKASPGYGPGVEPLEEVAPRVIWSESEKLGR